MRTLLTLTAATAASLALVACGGGSDDWTGGPGPGPSPAPLTAVPDSAITSSDALVGYLIVQPSSDEVSEALTLPAGEPFTSETQEPYSI